MAANIPITFIAGNNSLYAISSDPVGDISVLAPSP